MKAIAPDPPCEQCVGGNAVSGKASLSCIWKDGKQQSSHALYVMLRDVEVVVECRDAWVVGAFNGHSVYVERVVKREGRGKE
jgi:hypothetical protein